MDIAKRLKIRHSGVDISMDYSIKKDPNDSCSPNSCSDYKGENFCSTIDKLFQHSSSSLVKNINKSSFLSNNIRFSSSFTNLPELKGKTSSDINGIKSSTNPLELSFGSSAKFNQKNLKNSFQPEKEEMLKIEENVNEKRPSEEKISSNNGRPPKKKSNSKHGNHLEMVTDAGVVLLM